MKVHNDKNVYILGAGFSRIAGLPLSYDFMNYMRDRHQRLEKLIEESSNPISQLKTEYDAIEAVLKYRLKASAVNYRINIDLENIEDLFSLGTITKAGGKFQERIRIAIASVIHGQQSKYRDSKKKVDFETPSRIYTESTLQGKNKNGIINELVREYASDYYTLLLSLLIGEEESRVSNNTFITLNYDTIIEDALGKLNVPMSYGVRWKFVNKAISTKYNYSATNDGLKVLKLHGSVNWRIEEENKISITDDYGSGLDNDDDRYIPYIIPPIASKGSGVLSPVWSTAAKEISEATRIVVIGYSFPKTDNHIRYLIANGLSKNVSLRGIHIWDPKPDIVTANWEQLSNYSRSILKETRLNGDITSFLNPRIFDQIGRDSSIKITGYQ